MARSQELQRKPLISRASIFILAGFLIGLSTAANVDEDLRRYVHICGWVGLISLVGLHATAVSPQQQSAEEDLLQRAEGVLQLLRQHIDNLPVALQTRVQELAGTGLDTSLGQRQAGQEAEADSKQAAMVASAPRL